MPTLARPAAALLLVLAVAGCDDRGMRFDMDTPAGELPADADDRFSILSRGGEVKLGLTDEAVYVRLSDEVLSDVDAEMKEEVEDLDGLGARIASAVTEGVSKGLRSRISWGVDDIRDIRWEDDRLVFEFEDGRHGPDRVQVDGEDFQEAFSEDDGRAFIDAFREVKEGR